MVGLLLLSAILFVRINVLLSYYSNDLLTSLQLTFQGGDAAKATGIQGFWTTMLVFAVLAVCYVVRTLLDLYVTQRFIMGWRIWLSRRFIDDWLGDFARAYAPAGPSAYVVRPDGYLGLAGNCVDPAQLMAHLGATFARPEGDVTG